MFINPPDRVSPVADVHHRNLFRIPSCERRVTENIDLVQRGGDPRCERSANPFDNLVRLLAQVAARSQVQGNDDGF